MNRELTNDDFVALFDEGVRQKKRAIAAEKALKECKKALRSAKKELTRFELVEQRERAS